MAFTKSAENFICFFCQNLFIFDTREREQAESAAAAEREADERQAQHLQEVERQRQEEQRRRIQVQWILFNSVTEGQTKIDKLAKW